MQEAHDKYVASKGKNSSMSTRRPKRSSSDRFKESDIYTSGKQSVRNRGGRNQSTMSANKQDVSGNRSHSSSYAFLHLTKDLESIYREFEAGEVNELNKLRRLVSHFRGLSRRIQVQFNDLKSSTTKEIAYLKDQYNTERKKRIKV